jgi:hypothetical protein
VQLDVLATNLNQQLELHVGRFQVRALSIKPDQLQSLWSSVTILTCGPFCRSTTSSMALGSRSSSTRCSR